MYHPLSMPKKTTPSLAIDAMAGVGDDGNLLSWDADWSEYRGHPRTSGTRGRTFTISSFSVDDGGAKPDTANGGGK